MKSKHVVYCLRLFYYENYNYTDKFDHIIPTLYTRAASTFITFESSKEVKMVVRRLPKVGVGAAYGLPQTRYIIIIYLHVWWLQSVEVLHTQDSVRCHIIWLFPPHRAVSLASPRQLFKKSTMTSRWERREISNFEYLMFLNTIAGNEFHDICCLIYFNSLTFTDINGMTSVLKKNQHREELQRSQPVPCVPLDTCRLHVSKPGSY